MICPKERCRLYPARYDAQGRLLKRSCYYESEPRCLVGLIDLAAELVRVTAEGLR